MLPRLSVRAIEAYLARTDQCLSRSAGSGSADTSTSAAKQPLLLAGAALQRRVARNRRRVAELIVGQRRWFPTTAGEHVLVLCGIAQLAGLGLLPRGLFREWPYDWARYGVNCERPLMPPHAILAALEELMGTVVNVPTLCPGERLECVARVEWELGIGPIHPFYDGCGRTSRYYSCLLSLWLDVPLAVHTSRAAYYAAANDGLDAFVGYFRSVARSAACPIDEDALQLPRRSSL
ncbi:MAG TPA: hypothetical protein VFE37_30205 [Chloroflexota bacterium]|nr:hypothetical protein [Chloroflexota bacterium]